MPEISQKAIVEASAELADDVKVGAFAYIGPAVKIGPGCVIANNATVVTQTTLGANCRVFPMAVVGAAANDSEKRCRCVIGQANIIREHLTVYAGQKEPTEIGDDNLIMIGCNVGSGAKLGSHGIFANFTQIGPRSVIEDYVRTSGFALIQAGATIGAYTFISGYAGIDSDAPPYAIVQGFPFRVRGANTENLRRCGFGEDDIRALRIAFRELFNSTGGEVNGKAMRKLSRKSGLNRHVRQLIEFMQRDTYRTGQNA